MAYCMITIYVIIAISIIALLIFGGLAVNAILPKSYLQVGDKVNIFLDGVYDRTATITDCKKDQLTIYGSLPLPLEYRGKFYAVGLDSNGVEFWYIGNRKYYRLVPIAEKIRKAYKLLPDQYNLAPVYNTDSNKESSIETVSEDAK